MPERATIFHVTQLGVETTPGTAVVADKLLQAIGLTVKPSPDIQQFRPAGQKFVTTTALNREWTEAKAAGAISYEEVIYPLASLLSAPTITGPVNTVEYTHAFTMRRGSPDSAKTYTFEQGGGPRAHRFTNGFFSGVTLKFARNGVELDGQVMGTALVDNIYMSVSEVQTLAKTGTWSAGRFTLTLGGVTSGWIAFNATAQGVETGNGSTGTPYVTIQAALDAMSSIGAGNSVAAGGPIDTTNVTVQFTGALGAQNVGAFTADVTLVTGTTPGITITETTPGVAPTTLALKPVAATHVTVETHADGTFSAATALTRPITAEWAVTNRFQPVYVLNGQQSFVAIVETVPTVSVKLLVEADAQGMALLADMRAGNTKFVRVKCSGAVIAGGVNPYLLTLDTACRVTEVGEFSDSDGLYALEFTLTGVYDAALGSATKVAVRNTRSAL